MGTWTSAVWGDEEFLAGLRTFVAHAVDGPATIEVVARQPWSAVWRVRVGSRTSYLKTNCPGQAFEARLVRDLARVAPDQLVPVIAADPERDLLLTEDLGPTLEQLGRATDVDAWCRVVAESAALQRRVATTGVDLGLTVMEPCDASTYVADAVGRLAALAPGDPRRLDPDVAHRLEALLPTVERWSDRVDDLDLPLTLVHNDLHAANVVPLAGTLRFFDFGDAVAGEPLANLLIPLHIASRELGAGRDDPRLWRIADAGLEVWNDLVPMADLREALPASLQLARLARVESWRRCVATMTPEEQAQWGYVPARWLGMLLEPPPVEVRPSAART
ncbi:phosphotransferase [Nocardioides sp. J54]|uniref:phosphotransferase n=1 Tax=Nocardioides sp. J54 TaxID=935866 RepID=UPI0012FB2E30|nr:phosphotransferase [Nocardioides sp. J54]